MKDVFVDNFGAECIETACAFANAAGGYVVIGVDDRGVPSKTALKTALKDDNDEIVAKILAH